MSRSGRTSNPGWFTRGFDPRRHPLTTEERRRGGKAAMQQLWKTHPKFARYLLETRIKTPIDRQARSAWLQAILAARAQQPDDIPYSPPTLP